MNILYLTLEDFDTLQKSSINTDLLREFIKQKHQIFVISPMERRKRKATQLISQEYTHILKLKIGNIQKTNIIEKGINTIMIEPLLIRGIEKYFRDIKFDLVIYNTPPITFCRVVEYIKKRDNAKTYLLLKDIFPQNAVDIGLMSKNGIKGLLYQYFRSKEKKLYRVSDTIGCMSEANVDYVLTHNAEVSASKVEVCPNSIAPIDMSISTEDRNKIRLKYGIPIDKVVFVYGGNLGKPQGIPFMLKCLHSQKKNTDVFFFIAGSGTEYKIVEKYIKEYEPSNIRLQQCLPKEDYDKVVAACDVGLIFLDHRFTIPNFPSRLLSYMTAKIPVLAVTDTATDIGKVIENGGFGWWCESNDVKKYETLLEKVMQSDLKAMGNRGFQILDKKYNVKSACATILCR